jgi:hypothetical protein
MYAGEEEWHPVAIVDSLEAFEAWFKKHHPKVVIEERVVLGHKYCRLRGLAYSPFMINFCRPKMPNSFRDNKYQRVKLTRLPVLKFPAGSR